MALSQVITPSMPQSGRPTPAHKFMFHSNFFVVLACVESLIVYALGVSHHVAKVGGVVPSALRHDVVLPVPAHPLSRWLVDHKLDLGELIDVVFSMIVPMAYILDMKIFIFPALEWTDFNMLFPVFYMLLTIVSQCCMGTDFIYRLPPLRYCVPHVDKPYLYDLLPSNDPAEETMEAQEQFDNKHERVTNNPVLEDDAMDNQATMGFD
eukprot:COSAG02_NODE_1220_length_13807_cov_6.303254_14_plen_208_part_00